MRDAARRRPGKQGGSSIPLCLPWPARLNMEQSMSDELLDFGALDKSDFNSESAPAKDVELRDFDPKLQQMLEDVLRTAS